MGANHARGNNAAVLADTLDGAACPHCADGGKVEVIKVSSEDSGVFKPLPAGWDSAVYMFRCQCGWSMMLSEKQANAHRR